MAGTAYRQEGSVMLDVGVRPTFLKLGPNGDNNVGTDGNATNTGFRAIVLFFSHFARQAGGRPLV